MVNSKIHVKRKRVRCLSAVLAAVILVLWAEPVRATSISDLERQKQEMIEAIRTMERDKNKNFSVKQIEKNLKSTEERIKKLMDARSGMT